MGELEDIEEWQGRVAISDTSAPRYVAILLVAVGAVLAIWLGYMFRSNANTAVPATPASSEQTDCPSIPLKAGVRSELKERKKLVAGGDSPWLVLVYADRQIAVEGEVSSSVEKKAIDQALRSVFGCFAANSDVDIVDGVEKMAWSSDAAVVFGVLARYEFQNGGLAFTHDEGHVFGEAALLAGEESGIAKELKQVGKLDIDVIDTQTKPSSIDVQLSDGILYVGGQVGTQKCIDEINRSLIANYQHAKMQVVLGASDNVAYHNIVAYLSILKPLSSYSLSLNGDGMVITLLNSEVIIDGTHGLEESAKEVLANIADNELYAHADFVIEGHTESVGAAPINRELSERTAASFASHLDSWGIGDDRTRVVGYGEENPIADNGTIEGRTQNNRVVIRIKLNR